MFDGDSLTLLELAPATVFFTDRALYRPGQTIQYKGICLRVDQRGDRRQPEPPRRPAQRQRRVGAGLPRGDVGPRRDRIGERRLRDHDDRRRAVLLGPHGHVERGGVVLVEFAEPTWAELDDITNKIGHQPTIAGSDEYGHTARVSISPSGTHAVNYAFDITPARLVTGLITERGVLEPSREALARAFPERASRAQEAAE